MHNNDSLRNDGFGMRLKSAVGYLVKCFVAGMLALVILSAFSFLYGYSGIHITNQSGATDYKWEPNQLRTTMSEGFAWLKMNDDGYNNASAKGEHVDILLMGSSHMEGTNVAVQENTGSILNDLHPELYTYNIGMSGHTIYHCINNIENALSEYQPSGYVIMETSTVSLETESMQQVVLGTYPHIKSYDAGMMYWIQKNVPAAKSIYNQIVNWKQIGDTKSTAADTDETQDGYNEALSAFLLKYATAARDHGVTPIIFYHPQTDIDENGTLTDSTNPEHLVVFSDTCKELGIIFVDMTEDFQSLYKKQSALAHGFVNTSVGSGHLNARGHMAIAKRLAAVIEEAEQNVAQ